MFETSPIGMCAVTVDGTVVRTNDAVRNVLGGDASSILDVGVVATERDALAKALRAVADGTERMFRRELHSRDRWLEISGIRMHGGAGDVMLHVVDVTERHRRETISREPAERDPVTGLPNRLAFHEFLRRRLATDPAGTLLLLNLEGFKTVNDARGQRGDQVLLAVAKTLRAAIAETDVAARIGSETFALLVGSPSLAKSALGPMLTRRVGVVATAAAGTTMTASIGIVDLATGATAEALIENADRAMRARGPLPPPRPRIAAFA
jgi:diguanylate cyclase (GGDEF)-like protein/PAS domain S-box-containing protein